MKAILAIFLFFSLNLFAQDENTLGYFSFDGSMTQISSNSTGSAGVTLALTKLQNRNAVINSLSFGIVGNFFFDSPDTTIYNNLHRFCGYGGLLLEPSLFSEFPIHITIPCVIGIGTLKYATETPQGAGYPDHYGIEYKSPAFMVFTIGARAEFNLLESLRFTCGPSYRYVPNLYVDNVKSTMLNNWSLDFSFKIGKYN